MEESRVCSRGNQMEFLNSTFVLLQLLHLFAQCNGQYYLSISPKNPIVPLGGSVQLNCSISCPGGYTTWKGLDTNLGGLYYNTGYSVLTIQNATVSMEGTMICVGNCPGAVKRNFQKNVYLHVYALPDSLLIISHPEEDPPYLDCTMKGAYPKSSVTISWFRGFKDLDSTGQEGTSQEDEEGQSDFSWILPIPSQDGWIAGTTYRCEAEIHLNGHVLKREGFLRIPNRAITSPTITENMGLLVTTIDPAIIRYPVSHSVGSSQTLHIVKLSSTQRDKPTLPKDSASQTLYRTPKVSSQSHVAELETTRNLLADREETTNNPIERTTGMHAAYFNIFKSLLPRRKTTLFSADYENVIKNVNFKSNAMSIISAYQTTVSYKHTTYGSKITYYKSKQDKATKEALSPDPGKNQNTNQMVYIPQSSTSVPPAHQNIPLNIHTIPNPTSLSYVLTSVLIPKVVPGLMEFPTPVAPRDGFGFTWTLLSALGLMGSLLLSLQLWRGIKQKGSFIPQQL